MAWNIDKRSRAMRLLLNRKFEHSSMTSVFRTVAEETNIPPKTLERWWYRTLRKNKETAEKIKERAAQNEVKNEETYVDTDWMLFWWEVIAVMEQLADKLSDTHYQIPQDPELIERIELNLKKISMWSLFKQLVFSDIGGERE